MTFYLWITALSFARGEAVTMPHAARDLFKAPPLSAGENRRLNRSEPSPLVQLAEISRIVNQVVATWHAPLSLAEQRGSHRLRYERPAILTPLDDADAAPAGHKIISGRDISPSGFSFTHLDPLACRRAIVTFAFENAPWNAVVLRLSWCRFTRAGIYQSGGKFLNPILPPLAPELILDELPYA